MEDLITQYLHTRNKTIEICHPLEAEDYSAQPVEFVSPPKWHMAHTTWFFESFILHKFDANYQDFDPLFPFLFNSYYNNKGERVDRHRRGNCTRPTVRHILNYRKHVDEQIVSLLKSSSSEELKDLITLGINHEETTSRVAHLRYKIHTGKSSQFSQILDGETKPATRSFERIHFF